MQKFDVGSKKNVCMLCLMGNVLDRHLNLINNIVTKEQFEKMVLEDYAKEKAKEKTREKAKEKSCVL
jgi:hypothetical protein